MQGLSIQFAYDWAPWLFFLLIPAFALTLIPYFRLSKRYRRTRNRIISMVLHLIVMVLAICALTGMSFHYEVNNDENEIILLVDVSDTEAQSEVRRDAFVKTVIDESGYDGFKVGVVTFGFTQEYAVPLTYDTDSIYEEYKNAAAPDTTATDIAAALRYARGLFSNPQSGKIVLITDAKETDEEAMNVVRSVSAQGIKVDSVYIDSTFGDDNVQVVGVRFPEQHVGVNQAFNLSVDLVARTGTESTVFELSDNGKTFEFLNEDDGKPKNLVSGSQSVNFRMSFETDGLHEVRVKIKDAADGMVGNNEYVAYYYLEVYDRVLIIDRGADATESDALTNLLSQGDVKYNVTRLSLAEFSDKYDTVDEIRAFDQVILNNISNDDLTGLPVPDWVDKSLGEEEQKNWFVNVLRSYVYDYGGGLFTTGGTSGEKDQEGNDISHAYNKDDLYNTRYQEMLPVQAIDYTPPVGVMLLIDVSGSVAGKLEWIRQGAHSCLDALTERDYIGIMTFTTTQRMVLQLTSRTEETKIREAINSGIDDSQNGSTTFYMPIERACRALIAEQNIARRHVVIVTDGQPTDSAQNYLDLVRRYHRENEITFSVVMIDAGAGDQQMMKDLIDAAEDVGEGQGDYEHHLHLCETQRDIMSDMREDLKVPELKSFNPEPFQPRITEPSSTIVSGVEYGTDRERYQMEAELGGFYGVKARSAANVSVLLVGDYNVPIYVQWTFGEGTVGSFMCDLSGRWSADFMADPNGAKLIRNIVGNLMPTENIRPNEVVIDLREENYINNVSVYADLAAGERIEGVLIDTADPAGEEISLNALPETTEGLDVYVTTALSAENGYTRCTFVIKRPGVYRLVFRKLDAEGNVIDSAEAEAFKSFSYSKEYDIATEESEFDPVGYLTELSVRGKGALVAEDEAYRIFADFVTTLEKQWDPRLTFMIIAMVLFLADIAVRKFKFKWPHELIRESKERKALRK